MSMIKNTKSIAQVISACAILFISCFSGNKSVQKSVKAIQVYIKMELVDSSFQLVTIADSFIIMYHKGYTIYMDEADIEFVNSTEMPDGNVKDELIGNGLDTAFVIFKDGDTTGLKFSFSTRIEPTKQLSSDYFRRMTLAKGLDAYKEDSERIISAASQGDSLVEVSIPTVKDPSFADTVFYYLTDELNDTPYTFSEHLEKLRNKKLVKVRSRWNTYYDNNLQHTIPGREFIFRRVDYTISEDIASKAIDYFKAHHKPFK